MGGNLPPPPVHPPRFLAPGVLDTAKYGQTVASPARQLEVVDSLAYVTAHGAWSPILTPAVASPIAVKITDHYKQVVASETGHSVTASGLNSALSLRDNIASFVEGVAEFSQMQVTAGPGIKIQVQLMSSGVQGSVSATANTTCPSGLADMGDFQCGCSNSTFLSLVTKTCEPCPSGRAGTFDGSTSSFEGALLYAMGLPGSSESIHNFSARECHKNFPSSSFSNNGKSWKSLT